MPQELEFTEDTITLTAALLVGMLGMAPDQSAAIAYSMVRTLFDNSKEAFDEFTTGIKDALLDIKNGVKRSS